VRAVPLAQSRPPREAPTGNALAQLSQLRGNAAKYPL